MATKPFLSQIAVPVGTTTGDVYYPQTSLLMHFNGTNGSTTMTDNSKNNTTVTSNNGAAISTVQSKFGGASGLFDGTDDYLIVASNSMFALNVDFTIECWFRLISSTGQGSTGEQGIISSGATDPSRWMLRLQGTSTKVLSWWLNTPSNNVVGSTSIQQNVWYHIALVRNGSSTNNVKLYLNGTLESQATSTYSVPAESICIGRGYSNLNGEYFNGYIDELRITKGIARYTSNFTPSTTQFLDSAGDANSSVVVNSTATGFAIGTGGINGAQLAKAWVNFNGTGTVAIRDSYNVSSITDNGTGDYTINYGTALNNSNYAISGITDYNESGLHRVIVYRSGLSHQYNTLGVRIQIIAQVGSSDATQDPAFASLMVLGN